MAENHLRAAARPPIRHEPRALSSKRDRERLVQQLLLLLQWLKEPAVIHQEREAPAVAAAKPLVPDAFDRLYDLVRRALASRRQPRGGLRLLQEWWQPNRGGGDGRAAGREKRRL